MWTMFSKPQTPARTAEIFKELIEKMKKPGDYPLDTMVSMGQLFDGLSGNEESEDLHYNFQDLSNKDPKNEAKIKDLCEKTFNRYIWKLEKAKVPSSYFYCLN